MNKAHEVKDLSFDGTHLRLRVDGNYYEVDLAKESDRLAGASQQELEDVELSPCGYGLHWPSLDEDLSIDGLIGVKHPAPTLKDG